MKRLMGESSSGTFDQKYINKPASPLNPAYLAFRARAPASAYRPKLQAGDVILTFEH
jgi:hypothetical protein